MIRYFGFSLCTELKKLNDGNFQGLLKQSEPQTDSTMSCHSDEKEFLLNEGQSEFDPPPDKIGRQAKSFNRVRLTTVVSSK